ncbi:SDR family NAD(P)-dependent oxidoreductase [Capnocytophaga canimorsus]|uniref:3-ketoacyl-acyl carrier protein reductase n=2 Tax=Capnocytophaga canimorsus TaxID=28188 RepID=F9YR82_CAPCC|nr:SDR family oxidoreductase [Capnocytophaga canimorsus]AEK22440.1 3-ketoacyl-acyl carrier protein reductase [Capnocytophaga canimorsus Cc5]ATA92254.1 NAD(P)-dependent oxidoreductase [Capnocytophaga canimorsus]GIM59070.1 short-chain dehydrogenase [Capnocytophaga canimorsus]
MAKKIIITGTSRGIGLALAKQLAEAGHQVLALSRNETPIQALKHQGIQSLPFDITSRTSLEQLSIFLKEQWGRVDVLIHNAGKLVNKPFEVITSSDFLSVYEVNVFGVAHLTQVVLPFMPTESHVVAISSMGGVQGSLKFSGLAAYSSSKGALITLMELLAEEYKDKKIAFNTLALGAVQTEMLQEAFPDYQANTSPEQMAEFIANFALNGHKWFNGKLIQVSNTTP